MRDVQTERKEALFIIFVAPLFSGPRERTRAQERSVSGERERGWKGGSGTLPGGCTREAEASCPAFECEIASLSRCMSVRVWTRTRAEGSRIRMRTYDTRDGTGRDAQ